MAIFFIAVGLLDVRHLDVVARGELGFEKFLNITCAGRRAAASQSQG